MNILTTSGLSKAYKGHYALKDVSMHIEKGNIYGFVGENGAGKTTLIRLVTGLAAPTSGSYALYDVPNGSSEIYAVRRRTGAIVETATMSRAMTALENLKVQCSITGVSRTEAELNALIERVGLDSEEIRKKKAGKFSLGMRQRLGIAMVMVSDPDFVIMDEPMNYLDFPSQREMFGLVKKLASMEKTIIMVQHDLNQALRISDRIVIMKDRKIVSCGTPLECLERGDIQRVFDCEIDKISVNGSFQYICI